MPRRNPYQIEDMGTVVYSGKLKRRLRAVFTKDKDKPFWLRGTSIPFPKGLNIRKKR